MVNKIEHRFNNMSLKIIIEIFLALLVIFICIILFIENMKIDDKKVLKKSPSLYKENIHEVYSKIKNISNINISSSKIENRYIDIELNSPLENVAFFINEIENINDFIKIDKYKITKLDEQYKINLKLSASKYEKRKAKHQIDYYVKEEVLTKINTLKEQKTEQSTEQSFNLNAIVFNIVYINNQYLQINEKINGYKLLEIKNRSIVLSKNENIIEVYLNE